jgi:hypothetical protein
MRTYDNQTDIFLDMIKKAIRERVGEVLQEETIKAQKSLAERLAKEADHLALSVLAYYSIDRTGTELRITVKKEV